MKLRFPAFLSIIVLCLSCTIDPPEKAVLSDPDATVQARSLFSNLQQLSGNHVLLGHQDAFDFIQFMNDTLMLSSQNSLTSIDNPTNATNLITY